MNSVCRRRCEMIFRADMYSIDRWASGRSRGASSGLAPSTSGEALSASVTAHVINRIAYVTHRLTRPAPRPNLQVPRRSRDSQRSVGGCLLHKYLPVCRLHPPQPKVSWLHAGWLFLSALESAVQHLLLPSQPTHTHSPTPHPSPWLVRRRQSSPHALKLMLHLRLRLRLRSLLFTPPENPPFLQASPIYMFTDRLLPDPSMSL